MVFSNYEGIRIACIAASVPEGRVDIAAMADDPNEDPKFVKSFIKKTGIAGKHKCGMDQTAADFSYTAAKQIEAAGKYTPEEIGVLINVTQNPDYRTPSTALVLHKRLGLSKSCLAFDVNLGCSGFVYGVSLAAGMLMASDAKKALVLVGDTLARSRKGLGVDQRSSNTTLLFGDASSATLLEKDDASRLTSALMSDGTGHKALSTPYNAWKHPVGPESIPSDDIAVFNFTINEVPALVEEYLTKLGAEIDGYDDLVLHQANMMIIKNIAKRVGMPMEKVPVSLDRFGNTSGASVPLTIVDKYGSCDENKEVRLLTSGYGVGLSWGVMEVTINTKDILPLTYGKDRYDDDYPDE
ncbi:MAG: ketoacyl-ACP synthase III [Clostridia bacterium]|nr:ketoacyl-ACP synthase III [Clostridia bacterium]